MIFADFFFFFGGGGGGGGEFFQEYQVSNSLFLDQDRCYVGPDLSLITVCKGY